MQRRLPSREHHKNNPAADLFTAIYSYLYPDKTPSVMNWQETVVVIIGIVVAIVAVRGIGAEHTLTQLLIVFLVFRCGVSAAGYKGAPGTMHPTPEIVFMDNPSTQTPCGA